VLDSSRKKERKKKKERKRKWDGQQVKKEIEGWMDGWMDGRMDRCLCISLGDETLPQHQILLSTESHHCSQNHLPSNIMASLNYTFKHVNFKRTKQLNTTDSGTYVYTTYIYI
jgi:hypothetical protein